MPNLNNIEPQISNIEHWLYEHFSPPYSRLCYHLCFSYPNNLFRFPFCKKTKINQILFRCQRKNSFVGNRFINSFNTYQQHYFSCLSRRRFFLQLDFIGAGINGAHCVACYDLVYCPAVSQCNWLKHLRIF